MVSVMKARVIYDPHVQRIVNDHCVRGNVAPMEEATSEYLIVQGIISSLIPPPTTVLDARLAERAEAAIHDAVECYRLRGGILIARRFTSVTRLTHRMQYFWTTRRPPRIAGAEDLPNYEREHERIARSSIAAQALKKLLDEEYVHPDSAAYHTERDYSVRFDQVEGFCMRAVKIMEQAYRNPDEWVAAKLKGGG